MSADFTMYPNDSKTIAVTVKNESESAIDITGAVIKWVLVYGKSTLIVKDNASHGGISIINALSGTFNITLTSSDTHNLNPGTYSHEARVTIDSSSSVIFQGTVSVLSSNV